MPRVLLLLPTSTYRAADFLAAAERMKVAVVAASERSNTMSGRHPDSFLTLDFRNPEACVDAVRRFHTEYPIDAVIPVDDETAVAAAAIGSDLCLKHNSVDSARAARDKNLLAQLLRRHSVRAPASTLRSLRDDPKVLARQAVYPCVLKPLFLSASRGVIRADDPAGYVTAWNRIRAILETNEMRARGGAAADHILEQEFIPGIEFALEGLLDNGTLRTLALFDKPDPLDGPYFEETIYLTPSRAPERDQKAIGEIVAKAAHAIGLREGPVHAELRLNEQGPWVIEIAARSIGGLCSRTLRFGTGYTLEDLILRRALGMPIEDAKRERAAAGVMMIPIPTGGILERVSGLSEARAVPGIESVTITARLGNPLVPLPEGSSYLGFIFSRAEKPVDAEIALRAASSKLSFDIVPEVP